MLAVSIMEHKTVSIPKSTYDKLERVVGHAGYRSVAEIVMFCIRQQMYQIDNILTEIEEREREAAETNGQQDLE